MIYREVYNSQESKINIEQTKNIIKEYEKDINALEGDFNYQKMLAELPQEELDGILAIDTNYENPWMLIFFAVRNILPSNYKHSNRCEEQLKKINELGFCIGCEPLDEVLLKRKEKILNVLKYNFSSFNNIL